MKKCILCNCQTKGSVGAAGIKWSMICQPCKDVEDQALYDQLFAETKVANMLIDEFIKNYA